MKIYGQRYRQNAVDAELQNESGWHQEVPAG
jgi:hypothetical protein